MNETTPASPIYQLSRKQWNNRLAAEEKKTAFAWRCCAGSIAVSALLAGGCVYLGSLPKQSVEYVALDPSANVITTFSSKELGSPDLLRLRQEKLRGFIHNLRTVLSDIKGQGELLTDAFDMILASSQAETFARSYFEKSQPYVRGKTETVQVDVTSLNPASADTWHVSWVETVSDHLGRPKTRKEYNGVVVTASVSDPLLEKKNPLGLFVKELSWDEKEARQ